MHWCTAKSLNEDIDNTTGRIKESRNHGDENNRRNEVRSIGNRLHQLFKPFIAHFIQHQGHDDRYRETGNNAVNTQYQCIFDDVPGTVGIEELFEVFQSYPVVAENAQASIILLESKRDAIHRQVVEKQKIRQHRYQQQIQSPINYDPLPQRFLTHCLH